jgi:hypothetical protein
MRICGTLRGLLLCGNLQMIKDGLIGATLMIAVSTAAFASCEEDSISSVSRNGEIIVTLDGKVFQVDMLDRIDSSLWLVADEILICDDEIIINKDQSSEKVEVRRLR